VVAFAPGGVVVAWLLEGKTDRALTHEKYYSSRKKLPD
jgi:hypothetical protein